MAPRWRKLLGVIVLLPALGAYLLGAAILGADIPSRWYFQTPYYVLAGVLWAFPTIYFIRWIERGSSRKGTNADETPP